MTLKIIIFWKITKLNVSSIWYTVSFITTVSFHIHKIIHQRFWSCLVQKGHYLHFWQQVEVWINMVLMLESFWNFNCTMKTFFFFFYNSVYLQCYFSVCVNLGVRNCCNNEYMTHMLMLLLMVKIKSRMALQWRNTPIGALFCRILDWIRLKLKTPLNNSTYATGPWPLEREITGDPWNSYVICQ